MISSVVKFSEVLPCQLTTEEKAQAADSLANALAERDALEDQKKAAVDQFKAQISGKEADISKFGGLVRTGVEYRNVPCERHREYHTGEIVVRRTDTGAVVSRRPMTAAERQAEFDDIKPEAEEPKNWHEYAETAEDANNGDVEGADNGDDEVQVFAAYGEEGLDLDDWCKHNCDRCTKSWQHTKPGGTGCGLETDLDHDRQTREAARRCGYFDRKGDGVWNCPEKEAFPDDGNIDPFKDGKHWSDWAHKNCATCAKSNEYHGAECCLEKAVVENDKLSPDIAKRLGYSEVDQEGVWDCTEKQPIKEKQPSDAKKPIDTKKPSKSKAKAK